VKILKSPKRTLNLQNSHGIQLNFKGSRPPCAHEAPKRTPNLQNSHGIQLNFNGQASGGYKKNTEPQDSEFCKNSGGPGRLKKEQRTSRIGLNFSRIGLDFSRIGLDFSRIGLNL